MRIIVEHPYLVNCQYITYHSSYNNYSHSLFKCRLLSHRFFAHQLFYPKLLKQKLFTLREPNLPLLAGSAGLVRKSCDKYYENVIPTHRYSLDLTGDIYSLLLLLISLAGLILVKRLQLRVLPQDFCGNALIFNILKLYRLSGLKEDTLLSSIVIWFGQGTFVFFPLLLPCLDT